MKKTITLLVLIISIRAVSQINYTTTGSLNTARWFHQTQLLPNGNVLAFGGDNCNLATYQVFTSCELYNTASGTWSATGSMTFPRTNFASVLLNNGKVLATGGTDATVMYTPSCETYDYTTGLWTTVAPMNEPRESHCAVKLYDGRILIAGGPNTQTSEIYDPHSNTWTYTDPMKRERGDGMSMVTLDDGKILAIGGSSDPLSAEIFDPTTSKWTLILNPLHQSRNYSYATKLLNGKVLIAGGMGTSTTSELYDPTNNTFTATGSFTYQVTAGNQSILMDDGNVLIHTLGDLMNPGNTQSLQVYNTATGTWSSNSVSIIGCNAYSMTKLKNDKILLSGGAATTGNGANSLCLLINPSSFGGCSAPNLALTTSSNVECYGKSSFITINSAEAGVNYTAYIGSTKASNTVAGPGNIILNLYANTILPGNNNIFIHAQKSSCPIYILNNNVTINVSLSIATAPVLSPNGSVAVCNNDSTLLSTSAGYPSYSWSNGSITSIPSLYAKPSKYYSVKFVDANGCSSLSSNYVDVYTPTGIQAGTTVNTCISASPFQLTGQTPSGGTWSGPGVNSSGIFNPQTTGVGSYVVTYSMCNFSSTRTVNVLYDYIPSPSGVTTTDSLCMGYSTSIKIFNSIQGISYTLRKGTTAIGASQNGNGGTLTFNTGAINTTTTFNFLCTLNNVCGNMQLVDSTNLKIVALNIQASLLFPVRPHVCAGESTSIKLYPSVVGVSYQLKNTYINVGSPQIGNGDTLTFNTGTINNTITYTVVATFPGFGCTNTLSISPIVTARFLSNIMNLGSYTYFAGDTIQINNTSNANEYLWTFDASANKLNDTAKSPSPIFYSTYGIKKIKMIGKLNPEGCYDSLIRYIEIVEPAISNNNVVDCYKSDYSPNDMVLDYHVDKKRNNYLIGYRFINAYKNEFIMWAKKTDSIGNIIWEKTYSPTYNSNFRTAFGTAITSDSKGNAYLTGHYTGNSMPFGNVVAPDPGKDAVMFILKIDPQGQEKWVGTAQDQWINSGGASRYASMGTDITTDSLDRIYLAGYHYMHSWIMMPAVGGNQTFSTPSGQGVFIAEYDTLGYLINVGDMASTYNQPVLYGSVMPHSYASFHYAYAQNPKIKANNTGDVFICGSNNLKASAYCAKYNRHSGGWKYFTNFITGGTGGSPGGLVEEITLDESGNVYAIGSIHGNSVIKTDSITIKKDHTGATIPYRYIIKINPTGATSWYNLSNSIYLHDIEYSKHNSIYLIGMVNKKGSIFSLNGSRYGMKGRKTDYFIAEMDLNGMLLTTNSYGSAEEDRPFFMENIGCSNLGLCLATNRNWNIWPLPTYGNALGNVTLAHCSMNGTCSSSACSPLPTNIYPNDIGAIAIKNYPIVSSGSTSIDARIKNFGYNPINSFTVHFSLDNGNVNSVNWTGTLLKYDTMIVNLGNLNFSPGKHTLKIWTSLPNGLADNNNSNDTCYQYIYTCSGPLNGTYYLGKNEPDFENFYLAAEALTYCGISGPVIIKVKDGTYNEQVEFKAALGSSSSNTITFEPQSNDSTKVIVQYNPVSVYKPSVVSLTAGCNNFIFNKITFKTLNTDLSYCLTIMPNTSYCTFKKCQILANSNPQNTDKFYGVFSSTFTTNVHHMTFDNNLFLGGAYGINLLGQASSPFVNNITLINNTFINQNIGAINFTYPTNILIKNNRIESNIENPNTGLAAIRLGSTNSNNIIEQNKIIVPGSGIVLSDSYSNLVFNNFITIKSVASINLKSGIAIYNANNNSIYQNSINVIDTSNSYSCAFYISSPCNNNFIKNNIFCNSTNKGYSITTNGYSISMSNNLFDYNDLFTNSPALVHSYYNSTQTDYATINDWRNAMVVDLNSKSCDPYFNSPFDLHINQPLLNNAATPILTAVLDIDNETRNPMGPDIGADEFTPLPLSDNSIDLSNSNLVVSPNPFKDVTSIYYSIENDCAVQLELYNLYGQLIKALINENQKAGNYHYTIHTKDLKQANGIYFIKLNAGTKTINRKIIEIQ